MCLYPRLIKNPKYKPNKKNGGQVPPISDKRVMAVPIGCGKCIECRKKKAREWQVRLNEDIKENNNGKFVTFTFSNESIKELNADINNNIIGYERDNAIAGLGIRRFTERWRKKYKKTIRHWFVTEIGGNGTENIHLHGIVWTDKINEIAEIWKYGIISIGYSKFSAKGKKMDNNSLGYIGEKSINYMIKYVNKIDEKHKNFESKIFASKGIGKNYIESKSSLKNKYNENTDESYRTRSGIKLGLPIYYRNKIYTDEEREKLWIEKLNKEERYILGNKISIKNGNKDYLKILKKAREKNLRLGFGSNAKNWNLIEYEKSRRELMLDKRINNIEKNVEVKKEVEIIKGINWNEAF